MTQDDVIKLWEKANGWSVKGFQITFEELQSFANLVAAKAFQNGYEKALAQPEQEGYWKENAQGLQRDYDLLLADYEKFAQQEQEPVAWEQLHEHIAGPFYTHPPQRTWVGLSDEEVRDLWSWSATSEAEKTANTQQHAFARAIEAKLKEKNNA